MNGIHALNIFNGHTEMFRDVRSIWLFLDYDGTLADFAPTPADVLPNPQVIELLKSLVETEVFRVAIVSGRRLEQIERLAPVPGLFLAGTYGIQLQMPSRNQMRPAGYADIRPYLERLKPRWEALLAGKSGFFLEDKGAGLALHARHAPGALATEIISQARQKAETLLPKKLYVIHDGYKFLEVTSHLADKGRAVAFLLEEFPFPGAFPVYIGDDARDEPAFGVVEERGGLAIRVRSGDYIDPNTAASFELNSPQDVHAWLKELRSILLARDLTQMES